MDCCYRNIQSIRIRIRKQNQPNFPLHFNLETLQNLADYFPFFSKKLLDLNPTTCEDPILFNSNLTFLFQPPENPNEFP